ncbi:MAG: hypothetical protein KGI84_05925 [Elusimicrobia bacterium]|nr:hypothetical protein [Elusimicrobiota bacterium]
MAHEENRGRPRRRVAVATEQVFFHHAKNQQSEITEGIRRIGDYRAKASSISPPAAGPTGSPGAWTK